MAAFLVTQQKQHLHALGSLLRQIEHCTLLAEADPEYYDNQMGEYVLQYALRLSQLAQSVFKYGVHTPNAALIGEIIV